MDAIFWETFEINSTEHNDGRIAAPGFDVSVEKKLCTDEGVMLLESKKIHK